MQKKTNYITPKGFKTLTDELTHLAKNERPEITKIIQWAAGNGDRSENADYLYGKKRLREIDRRLRFLSKALNSAVIIDPLEQNSSQIKFGATVTILDEEEKEITYSIVGVDEVDTKRGLISWKSPIGNALLGKEVGDEVEVKTPKGIRTIEVKNINYVEIA